MGCTPFDCISFFGGVLNGRPCGGRSWIPVVLDDVDAVFDDAEDEFAFGADDVDATFDVDADATFADDADDDTADDPFGGRREDLTGREGRGNCSPYSIETGLEEKGFGVDTEDTDLGKMRAGFSSRTGFTSRTGLDVVESVIT